MDVELVSIGDELLLGFTIDTNAAYFARQAAAVGIRVVRRATVGDGAEEIAAAVRAGLERTGAVVTSGGLGPTADDLTKAAIAALFGRGMILDEGILESLRARWKARWSRELPVANCAQAMIPEGATILPNGHGSAPGIWLEDAQGRWVAMLPGVPREFRGMLADVLLPKMIERMGGATERRVIRSRTLRTTGIAESAVADLLQRLDRTAFPASLAFLPGWEGVDLRLTVRNVSPEEADTRLEAAAAQVRAPLADWIYGEGDDDLAEVVVHALRASGRTIAVAESCTGGMLGMRLTAVSGASHAVMGGVIAYDNAVKVRELGVRESTLAEHGAVSVETAREMAAGVRTKFGVDVGVSITGIAGPGGGTPEKPVGTVCIGVDLGGAVSAQRIVTIGDRHEIRQRSAQAALAKVLRALKSADSAAG
ncbi:MAG: competence/damage-inducible protein A [Gemmatimonadetes bacterium]|nr:competence/damage-inducible protein A [Gemmatimonadota bacterium]MBM4191134.1 competence/damage-inducible protein A [Gemmatimonadota bacterium]